MQVDSALAPNACYHVPIIVDKKCPQFIYTMALGSAMPIPISNLTDLSTLQTNTSLSVSFCPLAFVISEDSIQL